LFGFTQKVKFVKKNILSKAKPALNKQKLKRDYVEVTWGEFPQPVAHPLNREESFSLKITQRVNYIPHFINRERRNSNDD
jgi:hypothetical protein